MTDDRVPQKLPQTSPQDSSHKPRPVVAAAIVDSLEHPTLLLCAQRSYPPELRGFFELPGGKVERGEDPLTALQREIHEELGTAIICGREVLPDLTPLPALVVADSASTTSRGISDSQGLDIHTLTPTPAANNVTHDSSDSGRTASYGWPILQGRTMRVWLAQLPEGAAASCGEGHLSLVWQPLEKADALPWLPTNLSIVHAIQSLTRS